MAKNNTSFIIVFIIITLNTAFSQNKYWVGFKFKNNTQYSISLPEQFLTQKSINRRLQQNYAIDSTDLPVNSNYLSIIKQKGANIKFTSKWFNGACVEMPQNLIDTLQSLAFVDTVYQIFNSQAVLKNTSKQINTNNKSINYGDAALQIEMLNGDFLHQNNYLGQNMDIAVIDAGFLWADSLAFFSQLYQENRVKYTYNVVANSNFVYAYSYHGMHVLSTMASSAEYQIVGTAPLANYYLLVSEDISSEQIIEEYYYVRALEIVDSLGVYVVNTSLGYTTFDDSTQNHTYNDLNGTTAINSKAAYMASKKGMLLVNAAGNWGTSNWHYIGTPADAKNILTVGAVDFNRQHANFSSFGPTADNRTKPEVCAMGAGMAIAYPQNTVGVGNGTSFASPIICGLAACLWQAFPYKNNMEIRQAIIESAHLYQAPNDSLGYGIPDFQKAYNILKGYDIKDENASEILNAAFSEHNLHTVIYFSESGNYTFYLLNLTGQKIMIKTITITEKGVQSLTFNAPDLPKGTYVFSINNNKNLSKKLLKFD